MGKQGKAAEEKNNKQQFFSNTWFWHYVIDSKFVSALLIVLLLFLTLFIFTQISYLFAPIQTIFSIVGPPVIFSTLLYYLLVPMVRYLERKGLPNKGAIWLVFALILFVLALAVTYIGPGMRDQIYELINDFPRIWNSVIAQTEQLLQNKWLANLYQELEATDIINRVTNQVSGLFTATVDRIGNVVGHITRISVTLVTIPFVLYYLLADGTRFKNLLLKYTPTRARSTVHTFMDRASAQVGSYVRGELLVAVFVSIIFYIGYRLIHLEYALILSIFAGVMNLIPYLGSVIAAIPALIIGAFVSPLKFIQVLFILIIEQTLEGRIISPQILGSSLDIHPLVILFILLVSGSLFGFMGLVLAVPGFAIIRILWDLFFSWVRENYDLYEETPTTSKKNNKK